MDGEACWATVHGVAKSWTQLSDFTSLHLEVAALYNHPPKPPTPTIKSCPTGADI